MLAELTQERLRELLRYDEQTGEFHWCRASGKGIRKGQPAGCKSANGCGRTYWRVRVDDRLYHAHRLAWLYVHGYMPEFVDHIDGNGLNNAIVNLRSCNRSQNLANRGKPRNAESFYKGVHKARQCNSWIAQAHQQYVGCYQTAEQAAYAYDKAATERYGEFAKTNADLGLLP